MIFNPSIGVGGKRTGRGFVSGSDESIRSIDDLGNYFDMMLGIFNQIMEKYFNVFATGTVNITDTDPIQDLNDCLSYLDGIINSSNRIKHNVESIRDNIASYMTKRAKEDDSPQNEAFKVAIQKVYYIITYATNMKNAVEKILGVMTDAKMDTKKKNKSINKFKEKFASNSDSMNQLLNPDDNKEIISILMAGISKGVPWQTKERMKREKFLRRLKPKRELYIEKTKEEDDDEDDEDELGEFLKIQEKDDEPSFETWEYDVVEEKPKPKVIRRTKEEQEMIRKMHEGEEEEDDEDDEDDW